MLDVLTQTHTLQQVLLQSYCFLEHAPELPFLYFTHTFSTTPTVIINPALTSKKACIFNTVKCDAVTNKNEILNLNAHIPTPILSW